MAILYSIIPKITLFKSKKNLFNVTYGVKINK